MKFYYNLSDQSSNIFIRFDQNLTHRKRYIRYNYKLKSFLKRYISRKSVTDTHTHTDRQTHTHTDKVCTSHSPQIVTKIYLSNPQKQPCLPKMAIAAAGFTDEGQGRQQTLKQGHVIGQMIGPGNLNVTNKRFGSPV